jgi:hypothetical protein
MSRERNQRYVVSLHLTPLGCLLLPLIGLLALGAACAVILAFDADGESHDTSGLMALTTVPAFLEDAPSVHRAFLGRDVRYSPTDESGPDLVLSQYPDPRDPAVDPRIAELLVSLELQPRNPIEWDAVVDTEERLRYRADFRCADVIISALVTWESPGTRWQVPEQLAELTDQLSRDCAAFVPPVEDAAGAAVRAAARRAYRL